MASVCAACEAAAQPVLAAAAAGHLACLQALQQVGRDMAVRDASGGYALHAVARHGHVACAEFLHTHGEGFCADPQPFRWSDHYRAHARDTSLTVPMPYVRERWGQS